MKGYRVILYIFICFLAYVSLNGCATVLSGGASKLTIDTVPKDVKILLKEVHGNKLVEQTTPCTFTLDRRYDYIVMMEYQGYKSEEIVIKRSVSGWIIGNIFIGGIVGLAIDGLSANIWNHNLHYLDEELEKIEKTGSLPDEVMVEYPIKFIQDGGQATMQYLPVKFFREI